MGIENKEAAKQDANAPEGTTPAEKAGLNTQPGKEAQPASAGPGSVNFANEPSGMEDVPKGSSPIYRAEYAKVLRDFHSDKLRDAKSQIVRELPEAKTLAAAQAARVDAGGRPSAIS